MNLLIRKATDTDRDSIWSMIKDVIEKGDSYVFAPDSSKKKMLDFWFHQNHYTYVAILDGKSVGTFFIRDNFPDLGSHVANAAYITHQNSRGSGIGRRMGEYSIVEAKKLGYKSMQFNMVVKSNIGAVKLWQNLGFKIIGEIPKAFNHHQLGLTNAYIMWKEL